MGPVRHVESFPLGLGSQVRTSHAQETRRTPGHVRSHHALICGARGQTSIRQTEPSGQMVDLGRVKQGNSLGTQANERTQAREVGTVAITARAKGIQQWYGYG